MRTPVVVGCTLLAVERMIVVVAVAVVCTLAVADAGRMLVCMPGQQVDGLETEQHQS